MKSLTRLVGTDSIPAQDFVKMRDLTARREAQSYMNKINGDKVGSYQIFAGDQPYTVGNLNYFGDTDTWQTWGGSRKDIGFIYRDAPIFSTAQEALADFRSKYDVAVNFYHRTLNELVSIVPSEFEGENRLIECHVLFNREYSKTLPMYFVLPIGIVFALLERKDDRFGLFKFHWMTAIKWEISKHTDSYLLYRDGRQIACSKTKGQWHPL